MIVPGLITALLLLWLAGAGAVLLLFRDASRLNAFEGTALAWLLGSGIISFTLWIGGLVVSGLVLQLGVTALAVLLAVAGLLAARRNKLRVVVPCPRPPVEWILGAVLLLEIAAMIVLSFKEHLGFDGLLNWEIKAQYGFLNGGVIPPEYFRSASRSFSHPGYPLFLPLTELWFYRWMGVAHQFWLQLIFPLYYGAGAILLATTGNRLTQLRWPGLLVAALFFFLPCLRGMEGSALSGYADVPLSVLYFTAVAYLLIFAQNPEGAALRVFAFALALLPWVKREGALLWLVAGLSGAFIIWRRSPRRRALLYLLPGVFVIAGWKIFLSCMHSAEPHEFLLTHEVFQNNLPRLLPLARQVFAELFVPDHWSYFWPLVLAAFGSLFFRRRDLALLVLSLAVALPISLYATTYLFSAWSDFSQHFAVSFSRLLLHVTPLAWLAVALALPWPRKA